jgi:putative membrane protein
MNKNPSLKRMLAVSAFAAMFASFGVQAQTTPASTASNTGMQMNQQSGSSGAAATASGTAKLTAADRKAIMDMAMSSMAEVEMGKLAQSKSQNADVKEFAAKMVEDHGKAMTEVQALAESKGVKLPTELDKKHKAMATSLEKMSGDAFDRAYIKQGGVGAHKETMAKLQAARKGAKDADVKAQVEKTIPVVETHLKHATDLAAGKSGSKGSTGSAGATAAHSST